MTFPSDEYTAGLFDGEGCVLVARAGRENTLSLMVSIKMTNKEVLDFLAESFETSGVKGPYQRKGKDWKPYYALTMCGARAIEFLERIKPYVIVKDAHVIEALKFPVRKNCDSTRVTSEMQAERESVRVALGELNRRGTR